MRMNDIFFALTDFCIKQDSSCTADDDTIATMIGELLNYWDERISSAEVLRSTIYTYRYYTYGYDDERIMPQDVKNNDVLCENGVIMCSVVTKSVPMLDKTVSGGYELVYDCDNDVIRLFYKVTFRDHEVITVYRTETDTYRNFDFFGFYSELTSQLKNSIDELLAA